MNKREVTAKWFENLRDEFCKSFEEIEKIYSDDKTNSSVFERKKWQRDGGGGGVMSLMHGNVFEKVGVNISTVYGEFSHEFRSAIPGTEHDSKFYATGISIVAHMNSPLIPSMHFNTRYIETSKYWFGGGGDLTPVFEDMEETNKFHNALKNACDAHNQEYYPRFKEECDKYFYLPHRNEPRGIGGIFYDYLTTNFENDFAFTKDVGRAVLAVYPEIVKNKMFSPWTNEQKEQQLIKRGRYVEFNLLHDRGTKFGLATGGNIEAILMSLPPVAKWL
ncbi:MAG: oxygen-dependent coproporphyrinogen oxidase [Rickettsiaceae bacterium]|nr:oxygen-dependent coproporphyrinogen oxidase [Rickettsiaceae bacterium]